MRGGLILLSSYNEPFNLSRILRMPFHLLFMQTPRSRTSNPFSHKRKQKHKHDEKECLQERILTNGKTDIEQTVSQQFFSNKQSLLS